MTAKELECWVVMSRSKTLPHRAYFLYLRSKYGKAGSCPFGVLATNAHRTLARTLTIWREQVSVVLRPSKPDSLQP